ncbi:MAG TPA: cytochrome c [Candidatus Angelobacter sp.]|nr:cytochrome c [Candidatus Angelobacter sp.]
MSRTNPYIILGSVILAGLAAAANTLGQEQNKPSQQSQSQRPPRLPASLKGADLYHEYCASCHGVDGKGNGPVASSLNTHPADLTRIAERNGGIFPLERVKKIIAGDQLVSAHGSSEMPVWGPIFHQVERDRNYGYVRLQNLAEYLQTLQTSEPK